jgi:hypothetical protein
VARIGEERRLYKDLVGKPKERDHSEDCGTFGRMESERIIGRLAWERGNVMYSVGSG